MKNLKWHADQLNKISNNMKRPRGANEMGASDDRTPTEIIKRSRPNQLLRKLRNAQRHREAQIARPQGSAGNVRALEQPDALAVSQWPRRGVLLALVPLSIVGMVALFVMGFVGSREVVSFLVGREYVPTTLQGSEQDAAEQLALTEPRTPGVARRLTASEAVPDTTAAPASEPVAEQPPAPVAETETSVETPPAAAEETEIPAEAPPAAAAETATDAPEIMVAETETASVQPPAAAIEDETAPLPLDGLVPPSQDADVPPALPEDAAPVEQVVVEPAATVLPPQNVTTPIEQSKPVVKTVTARVEAEAVSAPESDEAKSTVVAASDTPALETVTEITAATSVEEEEEPLMRRDNDDLSEDLQKRETAPVVTNTVPETAPETPDAAKPIVVATAVDVAPTQDTAAPADTAEAADLTDTAAAGRFIGEGHSLMAAGDIVQARQLFTRSLATGSAEAALALGRSFDPKHIAAINNANAAGDPVTARKWYEEWYRRSVEQGSISPKVRLERLLQAMSLN